MACAVSLDGSGTARRRRCRPLPPDAPGGIGGREAIEQLRRIDPGVKAIVSSGYSSDPVLANYRAYGFRGMVAKPYKIEDFTRVLREVMRGSHPPIPIKLPGQPEGR